MRIGLVCPYSWDVPGGVQFHVRDLAEHFIRAGHDVSVLAPADDDTALPDYLTSAGRPVPVRYNGSVARVTFGPGHHRAGEPLARGRAVRRAAPARAAQPVGVADGAVGLDRAGGGDLPLGDAPLPRAARGPPAAAARRWRRSAAGSPSPRTPAPRCSATSVVRRSSSPTASTSTGSPPRRTRARVARHRRRARPWPSSAGSTSRARASRWRSARCRPCSTCTPGRGCSSPGPGDAADLLKAADPRAAAATTMLGMVSDADKASLLRSVDAYVAPAPRRRELRHRARRGDGGGGPRGGLRPPGVRGRARRGPHRRAVRDRVARGAVPGPARAGLRRRARRARCGRSGLARARVFDWSVVADRIMAVYETVIAGADGEPADPAPQGLWGRLVRGVPGGGS